jgi:NAD(P)H-dependent FMN reductase
MVTSEVPAMSKLKIAIIISTTRAARFGHKPAQWIKNIAAQRDDIETEIVDLRDFPLPFFDEVATNAWAPTQNPVGQRWQKKVAEFDGYIFVTAEYNHGILAALKNALDYAYPEWNKKAAAFVGYGAVGGARAIEHLRLVAAELQMATIRTGVYIQGADFMAVWREGKDLKEITYLEAGVKDPLDQLVWWTRALKAARRPRSGGRGRLTRTLGFSTMERAAVPRLRADTKLPHVALGAV